MADFLTKKPEILKSILDMKFMKKTKERLEKIDGKDTKNILSSINTNSPENVLGNFISESSYLFCEDLMEGRLSFKGMNPEIERLMELENPSEAPDDGMVKDISDEILAKKMAAFNKRKRETSSTPNKEPVHKKKRK